ncbi:hypothetical protein L596_009442 [Steinernema carpocapsae]|uniref:Uncharacterized protein n=1 Tax=Steinernema carpocapsae TaxID=34508 RepID=A0A4U5PFJ8_STECR|nr:hypothetical protein L596_009442 [Steinernema carpocapsae]
MFSNLILACFLRFLGNLENFFGLLDCFSLPVPSDADSDAAITNTRPLVRITTEEFSIPSVQRVVIVDADKENCAPRSGSSSFYPPPVASPRRATAVDEVWQASPVQIVEEPIASTSELVESSVDGSENTQKAQEGGDMETCRLKRAQAIEEIPVYEPDLSALPAKSVLKRPGAPKKFVAKDEGDLPTRLTDDSDSEADIQYRDENEENTIRRRRRMQLGSISSIGRSTNPAIASKIEAPPSRRHSESSEESEEEVEVPRTGLAARVNRRDTIARKLDVPDPVDDIPNQTSEERRKLMHRVSIKLESVKCKRRPTNRKRIAKRRVLSNATILCACIDP